MRTDWERIANTRAELVTHWSEEVSQLRRENAELLEALRLVVHDADHAVYLGEALNAARAAIAKATGG